MKKFLLIGIMLSALWCDASTISPTTGEISETETCNSPELTNTPKQESEKSFIEDKKLWHYVTLDGTTEDVLQFPENIDNMYFFSFNGTTEISGKEYHNLYFGSNESVSVTSLENLKAEDVIDFTKPPYTYIRQEGEKYYMLWGDSPRFDDGGWKIYGSREIETCIYDFSVPAGGEFRMIDDKYLDQPDIYNSCSLWGSIIKVLDYSYITSRGNEYRMQNSGFIASDELGEVFDPWGFSDLALPNLSVPCDCIQTKFLSNVWDSDGNLIWSYEDLFKVLGIEDSYVPAGEPVEIYDLSGRKVSNPEPGIYIVKDSNGRISERVVR